MVSFSLRLGAFGFRGRGPRSLPGEPLCLQTLTVVSEGLLRDLVLSHCLLGIDLAKCLTRIALGFGGRLWWLKPARRLCHFFAFSPISTASRASLSALRRLWFAWNSGSAWLSDIVCLDESGWRARRSSSSATCCSADRFGLIICFFPSPEFDQAADGFLTQISGSAGWYFRFSASQPPSRARPAKHHIPASHVAEARPAAIHRSNAACRRYGARSHRPRPMSRVRTASKKSGARSEILKCAADVVSPLESSTFPRGGELFFKQIRCSMSVGLRTPNQCCPCHP
jgi:hypothetical protein